MRTLEIPATHSSAIQHQTALSEAISVHVTSGSYDDNVAFEIHENSTALAAVSYDLVSHGLTVEKLDDAFDTIIEREICVNHMQFIAQCAEIASLIAFQDCE